MKLTFISTNILQIRIDGLLHLYYKKAEFIALHSYRDDDLHPSRFFIILKFKTTNLKLEYDTQEKWKQILEILSK